MTSPSGAKSIVELRSLSDEELIAQHDQLASSTIVGVAYYLAELERRTVKRQGRLMIRLTWIIAVLTAVNVAAVILSLVE